MCDSSKSDGGYGCNIVDSVGDYIFSFMLSRKMFDTMGSLLNAS